MCSVIEKNLKEGIKEAQKATVEELNKDYGQAVKSYTSAIHYLHQILACKDIQDDPNLSLIQARSKEYEMRIVFLKNLLKKMRKSPAPVNDLDKDDVQNSVKPRLEYRVPKMEIEAKIPKACDNPNFPSRITKTPQAVCSSQPSSNQNHTINCKICWEPSKNYFMFSCGHLPFCFDCSQRIFEEFKSQCPICRKEVTRHKVYF